MTDRRNPLYGMPITSAPPEETSAEKLQRLVEKEERYREPAMRDVDSPDLSSQGLGTMEQRLEKLEKLVEKERVVS